ncbi:something about silencing protein 10-like [Haliotis cracherodii]|uniref:something about silencing protein 10-like n=1 Tax=Haliotis cracherodii TaxID=6455 RepID=UPI0039EC8476
MGKRGQGVRRGGKPLNVYNSDDDPDPESQDFYHDDIDDFHEGRNKVLLDEGYKDQRLDDSDEEEEVMNVVSDDDLLSSDDDDDEIRMYKTQLRRLRQHHLQKKMDSDLEEEAEDDGLPDSKAWGAKRNRFYHADIIDNKFDLSGSDEETGNAAMEEKEALALQRKMAEEMSDQDFGLDAFTVKPAKKKEAKEEGKVVKDLSKLSKREKLELLKKESPELLTLIEDYISKMTEVKDIFQPLLTLVNEGKVHGSAADYVRTRFHLNMNYCINVSFYLMLKAKHIAAGNHPVIKRLVQYRNLMKQLEPLDTKLKPEIDDILDRLKNGEDVHLPPPPEQTAGVSKKAEKLKRKLKEKTRVKDPEPPAKVKKQTGSFETQAEKDALEYYNMMKKGRNMYDDDEDEDEDEDDEKAGAVEPSQPEDGEEEEGKRAITYQIAKNKGMTTKRKREQRNPRVKHRKKFEKAKVRRKGQVREPRTEMNRYAGELTGIRAGIKCGVKLR